MKKTINYEKDILFKTSIDEICSISLEHDFTVDNGFLRGNFIVSGDYKINSLSLNKENFEYRLPLEYELENNVDVDTLSYDIENFEYNVKDDVLSVYIDFGIRYEEKKVEPIIPITESEINFDDVILSTIDKNETLEDRIESLETEVKEKKQEKETDDSDKDSKSMIENIMAYNTYVNYHVHIVRESESLESIAMQYGVSTDLIKEYNNTDSLDIKSKLIIPEEYE